MRSTTRTLLIAIALLLAGGGAWLAYQRFGGGPRVDPGFEAARRALALPDAFALLSVDVAALAGLEGGASGPLGRFGSALAEQLLVEVAGDSGVRHALAAFYPSKEGSFEHAAVLIGSFDPPGLESRLRERPELRIESGSLAGQLVLFVARRDPDRCDLVPDWALVLERGRILTGRPSAVERVLRSAAQAPSQSSELERFDALAAERIVALGLFQAPGEASLPEPVRALQSAISRAGLGDARAAYLTLDGGGLSNPLSSFVDVELRGAAPGADQSWRELRDQVRSEWQLVAPTTTEIHDAMDLDQNGTELRGRARLSRDLLAKAAAAADELLVLTSRAFAGGAAASGASSADRVTLHPPVFFSRYPLYKLADFDPEQPLAGGADVTSGPFGVRLEAVRRGEDPDIGFELELAAVGPVPPNRRDGGDELRLRLASVQDGDGSELLRDEPCGADRNSREVALRLNLSGDWMVARKTLRLLPSAALDEVERIVGEVTLRLPVVTERERLDPPEVGDSTERGDVHVELTGVSGSSFSYRIRGDARTVLAVRGLNDLGQPLAAERAWDAPLWLEQGRVGAREHSGGLSSVEVVFAVAWDEASHPFALASGRPGTAAGDPIGESARFIEYSEEQYAQEFGPLIGKPFEPDPPFRALTTAGPFTLALKPGPQTPRLQLLAPDIPNLSYNLRGLELSIERIALRDGASVTLPAWPGSLRPARSFARDELQAMIELPEDSLPEGADIARIDGRLLLHLPSGVYAEALPALQPGSSVSAEGLTFRLDELARDRFTAHLTGDYAALVGLRAFNADAEELRVRPLETRPAGKGSLMLFEVEGQPRRLELQLASSSALLEYGFRLEVPDSVPAAADSD